MCYAALLSYFAKTTHMIFFIFLILFLLLIIYLLVVPLLVYIDTASNQYFFQIGKFAKVSLLYDEIEIFKMKLRVMGFDHYIFPLRKKQMPKSMKKSKKVSTRSRMEAIPFKKVFRVIKSFKVKQFLLDIDTGDCITNSKLYPVFTCYNFYLGSRMHVNYQSRNRLVLAIQNRPIRLIRAYMNI